jgi:tetratricopeptide (TPR) repeat protein
MDALRKRKFDVADRFFSDALRCFNKLGDQVKKGCVAHQLGVSYREQGRYDEAITIIKKAARIFHKIKPKPRWECLANAVFDINLCFSKQKKFKESQEFLTDARPFVPDFPQDDQAKYFYNLALSQFKQNNCRDAAVGFGLAVALLKAYIHANNLFEHCPRGLVHLLANAHLNQAESLSQFVAEQSIAGAQPAFATAHRAIKEVQAQFEQENCDIYSHLRLQQLRQRKQRHERQLKLKHAQRMRTLVSNSSNSSRLNSSSSSSSSTHKSESQAAHQELMRTLMPPPPPPARRNKSNIASKLKAKAEKGADRSTADVKRASYGIPKRMATGPSSRNPSGLLVSAKRASASTYTSTERKHSAVPSAPHPSTRAQPSSEDVVLRAFIEALYKKALELHLKAAAASTGSSSSTAQEPGTRNSNLELAAYAIQQLVRIYHGTGQLRRSEALLKECQRLECLTSNPRYQPHFTKWARELYAMLPRPTE